MTHTHTDTPKILVSRYCPLCCRVPLYIIIISIMSSWMLTDSVHSGAHSGTMSINFCHTAAVSGTMKLVFHIFSRSKFSTEHQFHCAPGTGGMAYVYRPSAAVCGGMAESDKHIKLIGLMTITMKKNNSDQTKGKPWTESVNFILLCSGLTSWFWLLLK